ncbi:MAG TPA: MarR family transcriptional regulator [Propionibacteriaceae bacterium]|nr:MarR family transcriptional regulator [Propionibacteriaceae bacterium]
MTTRLNDAGLDALLELSVLLGDDMNAHLARDGLTVARAHLLWELRRSGPVTQRVLSEVMRVSPRNITGLVDALVAGGFVTREAHPGDRRATLVTFTERGRQAADTMARQQRELADELFAGVTEESVAQLVAELRRIVGVLHRLIAAEAAQ